MIGDAKEALLPHSIRLEIQPKDPQEGVPIASQPLENLLSIFQFLDPAMLRTMRQVCKAFQVTIEHYLLKTNFFVGVLDKTRIGVWDVKNGNLIRQHQTTWSKTSWQVLNNTIFFLKHSEFAFLNNHPKTRLIIWDIMQDKECDPEHWIEFEPHYCHLAIRKDKLILGSDKGGIGVYSQQDMKNPLWSVPSFPRDPVPSAAFRASSLYLACLRNNHWDRGRNLTIFDIESGKKRTLQGPVVEEHVLGFHIEDHILFTIGIHELSAFDLSEEGMPCLFTVSHPIEFQNSFPQTTSEAANLQSVTPVEIQIAHQKLICNHNFKNGSAVVYDIIDRKCLYGIKNCGYELTAIDDLLFLKASNKFEVYDLHTGKLLGTKEIPDQIKAPPSLHARFQKVLDRLIIPFSTTPKSTTNSYVATVVFSDDKDLSSQTSNISPTENWKRITWLTTGVIETTGFMMLETQLATRKGS